MLKNNFIKIGLVVFLFGTLTFAGVEDELKKMNQKLDDISMGTSFSIHVSKRLAKLTSWE